MALYRVLCEAVEVECLAIAGAGCDVGGVGLACAAGSVEVDVLLGADGVGEGVLFAAAADEWR